MSFDLDALPLQFGKYRGRSPESVADDDPGYIVWLYENVPNTVTPELAEACRLDEDPGGFFDWDDELRPF